MSISKSGWELHIIRKSEQQRASDGKRRTVGTYQVYHDGQAQASDDMTGMVAETRGPGANEPEGNNRCAETGSYPLWTQDGARYVTIGYQKSESNAVTPKPGLELRDTGERTEILIHPGSGFLSSIGCINPCTALPNAKELIDFKGSRRRVIALIEDLKAFLGAEFPTKNGKAIPRAQVVIDERMAGAQEVLGFGAESLATAVHGKSTRDVVYECLNTTSGQTPDTTSIDNVPADPNALGRCLNANLPITAAEKRYHDGDIKGSRSIAYVISGAELRRD